MVFVGEPQNTDGNSMKRVIFRNEKELEGLKWTARCVDFGIGLMVASSINEMTTTYSFFLIERKDIFKGQVKFCCNNAFKEAKRTEYEIKAQMVNKQFWLDYSDTVIDVAAEDVKKFRTAIQDTLEEYGVKDAQMLSYVETTRVLLNLAVEQYKVIMNRAREKFGRDFSDVFKEYRLDKAFYWWQRMCEVICQGKGELNNEKTNILFDTMCQKFIAGEYIQACLKEAQKNNPKFIENKVEVKEL